MFKKKGLIISIVISCCLSFNQAASAANAVENADQRINNDLQQVNKTADDLTNTLQNLDKTFQHLTSDVQAISNPNQASNNTGYNPHANIVTEEKLAKEQKTLHHRLIHSKTYDAKPAKKVTADNSENTPSLFTRLKNFFREKFSG